MDIITEQWFSCVICTFNEISNSVTLDGRLMCPLPQFQKTGFIEHGTSRATPLNGRWPSASRSKIKMSRMRLAGSFNMWNPNEGDDQSPAENGR